MDLSKLIKKIDYFFIKTAMINVPDAVYNPIRNYVLNCLIDLIVKEKKHLSFSLEAQRKLVKLHKEITTEGTSAFQVENNGCEAKFAFPLEIMPYYNSMTEEHFEKYFAREYKEKNESVPQNIQKYKNLKKVLIAVNVLEKEKEDPTWRAARNFPPDQWTSEDTLFLGMITIPIKSEDIYNIVNLQTSIIHELTHFIQDYISFMINKNLGGGLPQNKTRFLNINPEGIIQQEKKCKKCKADINQLDKFCGECGEPTPQSIDYQRYVTDATEKADYDKSGRISYWQRDVEYYPLVRDAATYEYPYIKNLVPEILHRDLISTFVAESTVDQFKSKVIELKNSNKISGEVAEIILNKNYFTNPFFQKIKNLNPEKWQAAVKEFYKIISAKT